MAPTAPIGRGLHRTYVIIEKSIGSPIVKAVLVATENPHASSRKSRDNICSWCRRGECDYEQQEKVGVEEAN
jgi:hypothetical protein